jgi:hypothetical protein
VDMIHSAIGEKVEVRFSVEVAKNQEAPLRASFTDTKFDETGEIQTPSPKFSTLNTFAPASGGRKRRGGHARRLSAGGGRTARRAGALGGVGRVDPFAWGVAPCPQPYLTESVYAVVSRKSIPPKIRQLMLHISKDEG